MRGLSLFGIILIVVSNYSPPTEALVDRSVTVNKGQSGFFSLQADDLINDDLQATEPISGSNETETTTPMYHSGSNPGLTSDPNKSLEPRLLFQRILDIITSIGVSLVMMGYRMLTDYLLSYMNIFRFLRKIPGDLDEHTADVFTKIQEGINRYNMMDL